jgi:alpha-L-fucosidase
MDRLEALGAWLRVNEEAIYGTRPWTRAEGQTSERMRVRFTRKGGTLYAVILGEPTGKTLVLRDVEAKEGTKVSLVGGSGELKWKQNGQDLEVEMPGGALPSKHAVTLKMEGME